VGEFGGVGVLDENTDTHEFPHFTSPMVWKIAFFLQQETEKKKKECRMREELVTLAQNFWQNGSVNRCYFLFYFPVVGFSVLSSSFFSPRCFLGNAGT
jgi:hypothetical protein